MEIRFLLRDAYARGGTVRATFVTATALARRGHDVEIVSILRRTGPTLLPPPPGVVVRNLAGGTAGARESRGKHTPRWWQALLAKAPSVLVPRAERRFTTFSLLTDLQLARYLRGVHGGVVVGTRPALNLVIARLARRGVTTVGQEHQHVARHQRLRRRLARWYPRLDLVVTLTERDAQDYRRLLGDRARVVAVPNSRPDTGERRTSTGGTVVLAVGRLTRQKGFERAIRAFSRIAADHPDWQLHIYGDGPRRDRLARLIQRRRVGDRVRLMGFSPHVWDEMTHAAFLVLSSRFEGFPMVLLEAMGIGLPVVAFDCPTGPAELVQHGTTGLLVPTGDVPGLAAAMSELMSDEPRRRAMGAAAVTAAHAYDTDAVAARWEELFRQAERRRAAAAGS